MNNVAEGFGRFNDKEFIRFLDFAQSSGLEVRSMAYVLIDRKYITNEQFEVLLEKANKQVSLTNGLIRYLRSKRPTAASH